MLVMAAARPDHSLAQGGHAKRRENRKKKLLERNEWHMPDARFTVLLHAVRVRQSRTRENHAELDAGRMAVLVRH